MLTKDNTAKYWRDQSAILMITACTKFYPQLRERKKSKVQGFMRFISTLVKKDNNRRFYAK